MAAPLGVTVVVPVHNEAPTLEHAILAMLEAATPQGVPFEILICENGSTDDSLAIAKRLSAADPHIRIDTLPVGDYGHALRHSIRVARYEKVVIFNLDFWSGEFLKAALAHLDTSDMVIGSKIKGRDRRPLVRRLITRSFNAFLRVAFGFRGTDTHGMKAFLRTVAVALTDECTSAGSIFDTELVIRAERDGYRIVEIPVDAVEVRAPSYLSIVNRVPETLRNLERMRRGLRADSSRIRAERAR